jgi:tetratricopeptide (TPR) repeat protein
MIRLTIIIVMILLFGCGPSDKEKRLAERHYNFSKYYESFGKYDEAYEECSKAINLNYEEPKYLVRRGNLAVIKNDTKSAEEDLKKAKSMDSTVPIPYIGLANVYLHEKKEELANIEIEEALKLAPDDSYVNQFVGVYYNSKENYMLALKHLEKVKQPLSDAPHIKLAMGEALVGVGSYEKALPYLMSYFREEKTDSNSLSRAYLCYAKAKSEIGDNDYLVGFSNALHLNPGLSTKIYDFAVPAIGEEPQDFLAVLLMKEICDQGHKDSCGKYIEYSNNFSADDFYKEGMRNIKEKNYPNAIEFFTVAINKNPNHGMAYNYLAYAYQSIGELDKAIENCKKSIKNLPDNSRPYSILGACYLQKEEFNNAVSALKTAIEYGNDHSEVFYGLGYAYMKLGYLDLAISEQINLKQMYSDLAEKLFEEIISNAYEKGGPESLFVVSRAYSRAGENRLAVAVAMKASKMLQ